MGQIKVEWDEELASPSHQVPKRDKIKVEWDEELASLSHQFPKRDKMKMEWDSKKIPKKKTKSKWNGMKK